MNIGELETMLSDIAGVYGADAEVAVLSSVDGIEMHMPVSFAYRQGDENNGIAVLVASHRISPVDAGGDTMRFVDDESIETAIASWEFEEQTDGVGDSMSLFDFIACVECGGFMDCDGYGVLFVDGCTVIGSCTNIDSFRSVTVERDIFPFELLERRFGKSAGIMWYNR